MTPEQSLLDTQTKLMDTLKEYITLLEKENDLNNQIIKQYKEKSDADEIVFSLQESTMQLAAKKIEDIINKLYYSFCETERNTLELFIKFLRGEKLPDQ